jgi:hypothetical protein
LSDVSLIARRSPPLTSYQVVLFAAIYSPLVLLAPQQTDSEAGMSPPSVASATISSHGASLSKKLIKVLTLASQVVLSKEWANFEALC